MGRFLAISLPLVLIVMGLFAFGLEWLDLSPSMESLAVLGLERSDALPLRFSAGSWLIETLALTALFLLVQGRSGAWWLDGLVAGSIGWVFRGPILVLSVVSLSRLDSDPWWPMSLRWLVLYALCGLILAVVAKGVDLKR